MRHLAALLLTLTFTLVGGPALRPILSAPADAPDLAGAWKLVLVPFGNDEFLIVDVTLNEGKLAGTVTSAQPMLGTLKTAEGTAEAGTITLRFPGRGEPLVFSGAVGKDGIARGNARYGGRNYPAQLVKTDEKAVAKLQSSNLTQKIAQARVGKSAKEQFASILALIQENPGHPMNAAAYAALLSSAEGFELGPEEVRTQIQKWIDEARPYGAEWTGEVNSRALKALQGKKAYASLATEMALEADKALPADAELDLRSTIVTMLARSARLAGKDEIALESESRARAIDDKLDAEYHEKVPPFKPEPYAGRAGGKGSRVVLMEIFTGAECPPCVAADVGFDALLKSYKPTEFIGLQHHLHIPGPDPLTNTDTLARQTYYASEVRGTPSTFFNGKSEAGGGGGMANAVDKYKQYRELIEPALDQQKQADIKLTATRAGDEVKIAARASANAGDAKGDTRPRLRLVLIEESVRYPGSNKLRFHHNVVRAFPGGVDGKPLEGGEGAVETTINLTELRKNQESYLEKYPTSANNRGDWRNPLPPIDLDDLAVVALVQDDADHSIWHAVQVPVETLKP
jgi:hypothetical protein